MACVDNMYTGAATYPNPDNGCNDPAVSATQGATMVSGYNQFSLANPTKSNTIEIPLRTRYTAPNAPVFHAFGIRGMTAGVNIGAGCNLLYLDFTLPVVVYATVAGALPNAETPQNTLIAPRTAANLAFEVWAQGAWANSNTGAFSLTRATKAVAPNLGMTDVPPRKRMVYVYNNVTQASGSMTRETYSYNHPITFYGQ
jgi:hypothetical protein